jgi:hypothetical protein
LVGRRTLFCEKKWVVKWKYSRNTVEIDFAALREIIGGNTVKIDSASLREIRKGSRVELCSAAPAYRRQAS